MADPLDLLTLEEAYRATNDPASATSVGGGGAGGHDTELADWITAISRRIDELCGPVVSRQTIGETHDGGRSRVRLKQNHATSASQVIEYQHTTPTTLTAETNLSKPDNGYLLDHIGAGVVLLRRRTAGVDSRFPAGRRNVEVDYTAGRYANTSSVDAKFKTAVASILRRLWRRDAGAWAVGDNPFEPPSGRSPGTVGFFKVVDPMVTEWLADELRPPAGA